MKFIVPIEGLPEDQQAECRKFIEWSLLASFRSGEREYVGKHQLDELLRLGVQVSQSGLSQLFESEVELSITDSTSLTRVDGAPGDLGGQVLVQLLPDVLSAKAIDTGRASGFVDIVGTGLSAYTQDASVLAALRAQRSRIEASRTWRAGSFARSAHYMGSKQTLAPFMSEIVRHRFRPGGTILDLMCGSGSAAGHFARDWKVIASDAQRFSRLLALVQGGGFDVARAGRVISDVLRNAHHHFDELEVILNDDVDFEEQVLASEFSGDLGEKYVAWATTFPRMTNPKSAGHWLRTQVAARQHANTIRPYVLFSAYYANLFFGVRQSIEIDSLRFAIDQLADPHEREWALGALICAVSACADNHGGHFAQPRIKPDDPDDISKKLPRTLFRRSLSVFQEFAARLLSLAEESSTCRFPVHTIAGPWQAAIENAGTSFGRGELLVYLDPPYTRDEYSRYYHLLETLVLYNYPRVSGRALVPEKGSPNRFSSEFFTRTAATAERNVGEILRECLHRGWAVLWSYADSGVADMREILKHAEGHTRTVDIFDTDYLHSKQGRKGRNSVREYFVYLSPS